MALLELIAEVLVLCETPCGRWISPRFIGLLLSREQSMVYIAELAVHQASAANRGQGKTDKKDAFVIADQVRMRQDVGLLQPRDETAVDLRTLTVRRLDMVNGRTRQTNRLQARLLETLRRWSAF
ncbi:transposase [Streptomyces sp. NPDC005574]|uniref:IS110 family transposase n=1 Tax=Streptomyces sp. NPDC005574 TaxID=3156891 RepID=UPI00339F1D15